MSDFLDNNWFTDFCNKEGGTAFSLQIKAKLHEKQSAYQNICIFDTKHFGKLMTIDGSIMLTERDNFLYHEMLTHPALFIHPNPQNVVIIGGGDCGSLQQVLRHQNVKTVTQIDIDEFVTRAAEQFFPELCSSNNDPRAKLLFQDGIKWMAEASGNSIDIIIVDSTDPVGPGEVLFTESFYRDCYRCLRKTGLLVQQSESPLYHEKLIKNMHHRMTQAGFDQTQLFHFPQPCYPSGWWSATIGSKNIPINEFREQDVKNRVFTTKYYNENIHKAAMTQPNFVLSYLG